MGLGINTTASSGGDFLPIVKYDARSGRIQRVDRTNNGSGWVTDLVDITQNFSAVMDLANIETGWISYTPPDFRVSPIGHDNGAAPSDKHKEGFRMTVKLSKDCGGDLRDLSSTAKVTVGGISLLHDDYLAGVAANPGMLPVVALVGTTAVQSEGGGQKSTNYAPVWKIVRWVNRPADLVAKPKEAANVHQMPPRQTPSTGSTKVSAPPPRVVQSADAEDFG